MSAEEATDKGSHATEADGTRLGQIMAATRQSLQAAFAELKAAFTHNTSKGAGGEALVAKFLQARLPEQVGATAGQVIDANGAISRQVDVVLYDRARTPMLFTSPTGHDQLIPVEGVLAVIEVKTHLTKAMLADIMENCRSVKRLSRTAYFERQSNRAYHVYDHMWIDFPIYYSVFAAKSDNMYAGTLNELQYGSALHERIDTVCYLDRGSNLNIVLNPRSPEPFISPTSSLGSALIDIESDQGLLHWYGALASTVAQVEVRPINILAYMSKEFRVSGRVPAGKVVDDMMASFQAAIAAENRVPVDVVQQFQDKKMTARAIYDLLRSPGYRPAPEYEEEVRPAQDAARTLSFEVWRTHWNITGTSEE